MHQQLENSAVAGYIEAQDLALIREIDIKTRRIMDEIGEALLPGMTETEAKLRAKAIFASHGIEQNWHNTYIYFGTNTLLTYRDKHIEEKTLQARDIVYLDLAPIIGGMEGDAGKTIVLGDDPVMLGLRDASEQLFYLATDYFRQGEITGIDLYEFVFAETRKLGYEFILEGPGHLVGAFPHQRWKSGLNTYPYPVEAGVWILEIHIKHPDHPYAAFYEALLS